MTKINMNTEMSILRNNFIKHYDMNKNLDKKIDNGSFYPENWIITFPYNFADSLTPEDKYLTLIRKLALVNSLYGYYFHSEDNVINDYHLPTDTFRSSLISLCDAHIFRNLAVGHLLRICGQEIFKYIYAYEEGYYQAIIFKKTLKHLTSNTFFDKEHLQLLGQKLIPICTTYAAYCILLNEREKIPVCEEMIIKYHIAKQMLDDFEDLNEDIVKPDLSYLLKLFSHNQTFTIYSTDKIKKYLRNKKIDLEIVNCMIYYLNESEQAAEYLKFDYFLTEIQSVKEKALYYKKKSQYELKNERTAV